MINTACRSIVLAAGASTRMQSPLSKLLHELVGKPIIVRAFEQAKVFGDKTPVFVLGHQREEIQQSLEKTTASNSFISVVQDPPLGTGDAVKKAVESLEGSASDDEVLFIMGGDAVLLTEESLLQFREMHLQKKAALSFMTAVLEKPEAYGRVIRNTDGQVQKIVEFKNASESERKVSEINAGFYCLSLKVLKEALSQLKKNELTGEFYLTDLVEYFLAQNRLVLTFQLEDQSESFGINNQMERCIAEQILLRRIRSRHLLNGVQMEMPESIWIDESVEIAPGAQIGSSVELRGNSKIGASRIASHSVIKDCQLSDACEIKEFSHLEEAQVGSLAQVGPFARVRPGSVLDRGARLGNFVETKNSHFEADAKANHLSYIGDTKVGKNSNIGAGTITCNYDGYQKHATELGSKVFVGSNSSLVAPLKIGEGAIIGAGSVISEDVPANSLALERSKQVNREEAATKFREKRES